MPAMHFHLRWPDGSEMRCYSPSLVIHDHFNPGTAYALPTFLQHCRDALHTASERVRAKYGFACSMALDQLALIEQAARRFDDQGQVQVLRFDDDGPVPNCPHPSPPHAGEGARHDSSGSPAGV